MIPTATMQLGKPEAGDDMEPYFLGQMPSLSFWEALERLSEHDHTGGLLGKPITAATIPDGSITTSKLDPSVLAPYALLDGSEPFTGQVTMQADAVVRDTLFFGEQGTTLTPDGFIQRTAPDTLDVGKMLRINNPTGEPSLMLVGPDSAWRTIKFKRSDGADRFWWGMPPAQDALVLTAVDDVGTGATRLSVARATGTLSLTPAAGQEALVANGSATVTPGGVVAGLAIANASGNVGVGTSAPGNVALLTGGGYWHPLADNQLSWGHPGLRFTQLCSVAGSINTSLAEAKQDIAPLDPAAALAAVLATDPVRFTYIAPPPTEAQLALPDDPTEAQRVLYDRLTNGPLAEAARHQSGFVLHEATGTYHTDPLFETGRGQSNPANSVGNLIGAIHELHRRLTAGGL